MVVKFADTEKEKLQKKMQQMATFGGMAFGSPTFPMAYGNAISQQVQYYFTIILMNKQGGLVFDKA